MYRLIYKSRVKGRLDKQTFRDILYSSSNTNRKNDITGVLLATHAHYLQIIEGEYTSVSNTFARISQDLRHEELEVISFRPAKKRYFLNWAMKGIGMFEINKELEKKLIKKYGEENGCIKFPSEEDSSLMLVNDLNIMGFNS